MDAAFKQWPVKGLIAIKDLYIDNHFASFAQLQTKYNLPTSHFYQYLQIRNYVKQAFSNLDTIPIQHVFYNIMNEPPTSKHFISRLVNLFSLAAPSCHIKEAWTRDTGLVITDDLWAEVLSRIKLCSVNARLQLIQFKVVHRLHYSKTKLNKIFPNVSPKCDKCKLVDGTLGHLFWSCSTLTAFWTSILSFYSIVSWLSYGDLGLLQRLLGTSLCCSTGPHVWYGDCQTSDSGGVEICLPSLLQEVARGDGLLFIPGRNSVLYVWFHGEVQEDMGALYRPH